MKKKNFYASVGAQFTNEQAQIYGPALERIRKKNKGKLQPDAVLTEAEKTDHPLHDYFEWNNDIAAFNFRKQQARHLINHIKYEFIEIGYEEPRKVYYNIQEEIDDKTEQSYIDLKTMQNNEEYREYQIKQAIKQLRSWCDTNEIFNELSSLIGFIRNNISQHVKAA